MRFIGANLPAAAYFLFCLPYGVFGLSTYGSWMVRSRASEN
jgi:hypothetical protein